MFFFVNLLGLVVFLGIGVLTSRNRKEIQWRSVASLLVLNLVLAWFLTSFQIGRDMITAAASGFTELINISYVGIAFLVLLYEINVQQHFFIDAHRTARINSVASTWYTSFYLRSLMTDVLWIKSVY